MKQAIRSTFIANITRAESLLRLYTSLLSYRKSGQGRAPIFLADILRSAVVFIHATVEELVRQILQWKLPGQSTQQLDKVPLKGTGRKGSPEKFFLGSLHSHRNLTVQQLLEESVAEYVGKVSYNSTTDIDAALQSVGIDTSQLTPYYSSINEAISRRHHIVHRADRNDSSGSGNHSVRSLGRHDVDRWIQSVVDFYKILEQQL